MPWARPETSGEELSAVSEVEGRCRGRLRLKVWGKIGFCRDQGFGFRVFGVVGFRAGG